MPRLKLTLAYDGSRFAGWQVQPNQPTVQAALQDALEQIQLGRLDVTGASRTDSGVHATGQVCHIDVPTDDWDTSRLLRSLNGVLPDAIRVMVVENVGPEFHARYDAASKSYQYLIALGPAAPPLLQHAVWHHPGPMDTGAMTTAAGALLGTHDFRAFMAAGSTVEDTTRTIRSVTLSECAAAGLTHPGSDLWAFEISGTGFLYKMVRLIVGSLVEIGAGRAQVGLIPELLESGQAGLAGPTAPASGLTLREVRYES